MAAELNLYLALCLVAISNATELRMWHLVRSRP